MAKFGAARSAATLEEKPDPTAAGRIESGGTEKSIFV